MSVSSLSPPLSNPLIEKSINGRAYIVTGGTQGLGKEIAKTLKQLGASFIVVVSRSVDKGRAVEQELSSTFSASSEVETQTCVCKFLRADLSSALDAKTVVPQSVELLRVAASERGGETLPQRFSGLVNAAAITARDNLRTATETSFDVQMNTNVRAPMLITQGFAEHLIAANATQGGEWGSVVNVSSCAAHGGAPFIMSYSVSKAALNCLTKNNAAELAPHGIRVNSVNMGQCATENEHKLQGPEGHGDEHWLSRADSRCPIGRILRPVDVASTICYLLSDCSAMVTGSLIDVHPDFAHGMCSLLATEK